MSTDGASEEVRRLAARVEALEAALERRSREMRLLQRRVCAADLVLLSRVSEGLPLAKGAYDPAHWRETTEVTEAEIEETLKDLWLAVSPPPDEDRS